MVGGGCTGSRPFRKQLERWKFVGGGLDINGETVDEPWELKKARFIDGLCQRYSCLPSQLLEEDVDLIVKMHSILMLAGDGETNAPGASMEDTLANMSRGI